MPSKSFVHDALRSRNENKAKEIKDPKEGGGESLILLKPLATG